MFSVFPLFLFFHCPCRSCRSDQFLRQDPLTGLKPWFLGLTHDGCSQSNDSGAATSSQHHTSAQHHRDHIFYSPLRRTCPSRRALSYSFQTVMVPPPQHDDGNDDSETMCEGCPNKEGLLTRDPTMDPTSDSLSTKDPLSRRHSSGSRRVGGGFSQSHLPPSRSAPVSVQSDSDESPSEPRSSPAGRGKGRKRKTDFCISLRCENCVLYWQNFISVKCENCNMRGLCSFDNCASQCFIDK